MYINYFNGSKYDKKYLHTTGTHQKFEILTKKIVRGGVILSWTPGGLACAENCHGTWGTCGTWFLRKRFVVPGDVQYLA